MSESTAEAAKLLPQSETRTSRRTSIVVASVAIALLITRSFQPVRDLFTNAWRDWTRVTFALFGFMPLVVMIAFDEIDRLYTFYFMVLLAVVMPASALAYLRSRSTRQQALALFSGIFITVMKIPENKASACFLVLLLRR